jgi:hypothetical protein
MHTVGELRREGGNSPRIQKFVPRRCPVYKTNRRAAIQAPRHKHGDRPRERPDTRPRNISGSFARRAEAALCSPWPRLATFCWPRLATSWRLPFSEMKNSICVKLRWMRALRFTRRAISFLGTAVAKDGAELSRVAVPSDCGSQTAISERSGEERTDRRLCLTYTRHRRMCCFIQAPR